MAKLTVKTGFFPLAFLLYFCRPVIVLDGKEYPQRKWGKVDFEITKGEHSVGMYFRYVGIPRCGERTVSFSVEKDENVFVRFWMPPWVLAKALARITIS